MNQIIEVNGIKLYAFHGCLPEEGKIGGHYVVDVKVHTDFSASFQTDDLSDTVDYVAINRIVTEEMMIRSKLIEHVGFRVLQRFEKELIGLKKAWLKVTKISPPIDGDVHDVAIILEKDYQ